MGIIGKILLFILKCLGVLVLLVIGLLLVVLLVPIRYECQGKAREDEKRVQGKVTWLFGLLSLRFSWQDSETKAGVRIFGIRAFPRKKTSRRKDDAGVRKPEENPVFEPGEKTGEQKESEENPEPKTFPQENGSASPEKEWNPDFETETPQKRKGFSEKFQKLRHKTDEIKEFLQREENRRTFRLIKAQLGKLFRHIRPRKLRIVGIFGFDDPALTGQVLGIFALLLPLYRDAVQITPDFTGRRLEGEFYLKGRIRIGALVSVLVRLLLDKNIRTWIRKAW
jgi:hypothetical protein